MLKALCKLIRVLSEILLGFGVLYFHVIHVFTADFTWDGGSVREALITHTGLLLLALLGLVVGMHGVREMFRAFNKEFKESPKNT